MTGISDRGHTVLETRFLPERASRAPAGAFGRRSFGRAAPPPAHDFEVEHILQRCRARRIVAAPQENRRSRRPQGDMFAYAATATSLLALCILSALPII